MNIALNPDFKKNIDLFVKNGAVLILGISGGPDSLYLLEQCRGIVSFKKLTLIIAHLNHGLRGKESDQDAQFVKKLAKQYGLKSEILKIHINKKKGNIEEIGRNKRYAFFEKLRIKYKAQWILTAHHRDDNIETVLLNLLRGSSFHGIRGMMILSKKRYLFRPLLTTSKKDILGFLKKKKILYRLDSSNENLKFSRNLLRKKIIPLFKKINTNFDFTFSENLKNFTEIANFLEEKNQKWLKKNMPHQKFPLDHFLREPEFSQKNILAHQYKKFYKSSKKLTQTQLNEILKVLKQKKTNRKKEFGSHYFIAVTRENEQSPRRVEFKERIEKSRKNTKIEQ